jgi:hypothetical protein
MQRAAGVKKLPSKDVIKIVSNFTSRSSKSNSSLGML